MDKMLETKPASRPCYNCEKRTINCHCDCEDYKAYKQELAEQKAVIEKEKDKQRVMSSYIKDNYRKRR